MLSVSFCLKCSSCSPLDFVVTPRNRLIYTILFAVMGTALISGYGNFGSALSFHFSNIYASLFNRICKLATSYTISLCGDATLHSIHTHTVLSPFITVVTLVLEYFPLFATVEFPLPILGYSIGCFYSIVWWVSLKNHYSYQI